MRKMVKTVWLISIFFLFLGVKGKADVFTLTGQKFLRIKAKSLLNEVDSKRPIPIMVEVENSGDAIKGQLQVMSTNEEQITYKDVELPSKSRKRFFFSFRPGNYWYRDVKVVFEQNGDHLVEETISARTGSNVTNILCISEEKSGLNFLADSLRQKNSSTSSYNNPNFVVDYLSVEEMPDNVALYEACDVIILKDPNIDKATFQQLDALRDWVFRGGKIFVCAGNNPQVFKNSFYQTLFPFQIESFSGSGNPEIFEDTYGGQMPHEGFQIFANGKHSKGKVLLEDQNIPLVRVFPFGQGAISFFSFDPFNTPFTRWDKADELWSSTLQELNSFCSHSPFSKLSIDPDSVFKSVDADKLPDVSFLILFLGVYFVLLLPINYYFLWSRSLDKMAWVTMPALVVIFTTLGQAIGCMYKSDERSFMEIHILHYANSRDIYGQSEMSLFSPTRTTYEVKSPLLFDCISDNGAGKNNSYGTYQRGVPQNKRTKICANEIPSLSNLQLTNWEVRSLSGSYVVHQADDSWKFEPNSFFSTHALTGKFSWYGKTVLRGVSYITTDGTVFELNQSQLRDQQTVEAGDFRMFSGAKPSKTILDQVSNFSNSEKEAILGIFHNILTNLRPLKRQFVVGIAINPKGRYEISPKVGIQSSIEFHVIELPS